jgi:hypothetical protein
VQVVREQYKEDALKGTILVSPEDNYAYLAWFVKSQILDGRKQKDNESIADEQLGLIYKVGETWQLTSPAKFIDLRPPSNFAKPIDAPTPANDKEAVEWTFNAVTIPQLNETKERVTADSEKRISYLDESFTNVIMDINAEINDLQGKLLIGNRTAEKKIAEKQAEVKNLQERKARRIAELEKMQKVSCKAPVIMGCAYVVPLSSVEYENHFGMSRDDEAEAIAMSVAMEYERAQGWQPEDVSKQNEGYDIRSVSPEYLKRYIEVKGRSVTGGVMLSENEWNRLAQLGESAWLYIVVNCKSNPELFKICNPAKNLKCEIKSKGIQYFVPEKEWKAKA